MFLLWWPLSILREECMKNSNDNTTRFNKTDILAPSLFLYETGQDWSNAICKKKSNYNF